MRFDKTNRPQIEIKEHAAMVGSLSDKTKPLPLEIKEKIEKTNPAVIWASYTGETSRLTTLTKRSQQ